MSRVVENMGLGSKLEAFLGNFQIEGICERWENVQGLEKNYVKDILCTFANEARVILGLVENFLNPEIRILEVGAGICLFRIFLRAKIIMLWLLSRHYVGLVVLRK